MLLEVDVIGSALPAERAIEAVGYAAASAGLNDGHVAVSFVSPERIAELNLTWRGKVGPTDVLSFPIDEDDEDPHGASVSSATCSSAPAHRRSHRGRRAVCST